MRRSRCFNCTGKARNSPFAVTPLLAIVVAAVLALTWTGCAPRARTTDVKKDITRVREQDRHQVSKGFTHDEKPDGEKQSAFMRRYEVVKYLVSTGELKEASSRLRRLRRTARSRLEKAMASEGRASLYLARRELSRAEKYASSAIKTHPSFGPAYKTRAVIRKERGDLSGSVEDFRSALALEPEDTESLRGLAEVYLAQQWIRRAVKVLERFLEVDPLDAWAQDTWCVSMGSLLACEEFPLDYLRTLRSPAVTRGELAAVLVVEFEMVRLGLTQEDWRSDVGAKRSGSSVLPDTEQRHLQRAARRLPETTPQQPDSYDIDPARGDLGVLGMRQSESRSEELRVSDCEQVWFCPFVEKAVLMGLLDVYPDGTLRPWDIVRKGRLAVELYSFLSRHCENALTIVRNSKFESTSGAEEENLGFKNARGLGYLDIYSSSYLWKPVISLVQLDILRPESDILFGVNSTLSGRDARRIARNLAEVIISSGCAGND